jgi:hypothetical protein
LQYVFERSQLFFREILWFGGGCDFEVCKPNLNMLEIGFEWDGEVYRRENLFPSGTGGREDHSLAS